MAVVTPKVELLDYTESSENNIAISAKLTHSKEGLRDLQEGMPQRDKERLVKSMIKMGHESTLEHVLFFFDVVCSRTCSHQIVRHRIGTGFSQRSERYVDNGEFDFVIPPSIKEDEESLKVYMEQMEDAKNSYQTLRDNGIPKEDARFILPRIATELAFSINGRALRHFLDLRRSKTAQWEIRKIANQMLNHVREVAPSLVFDYE